MTSSEKLIFFTSIKSLWLAKPLEKISVTYEKKQKINAIFFFSLFREVLPEILPPAQKAGVMNTEEEVMKESVK